MKIILASTMAPFVKGGARNIVDWLQFNLVSDGHEVLKLYLPQRDDPDVLLRQCKLFEKIDLPKSDLLVTFRPQSHLLTHHNKKVWFIHHIRAYYDLWLSKFRGFNITSDIEDVRRNLHQIDSRALNEAQEVFSNSKIVSERLKLFNNIEAKVLYPPLKTMDVHESDYSGNYFIYVSRVERHKRQDLVIEAMQFVDKSIRLVLVGKSVDLEYTIFLRKLIEELRLENRVDFKDEWISEDRKNELISKSIGLIYCPIDEDSYGYPVLEASLRFKPVITCIDSGGTLEIVSHNETGWVADSLPESIAMGMNILSDSSTLRNKLVSNMLKRIYDCKISWKYVLDSLLA